MPCNNKNSRFPLSVFFCLAYVAMRVVVGTEIELQKPRMSVYNFWWCEQTIRTSDYSTIEVVYRENKPDSRASY